MILTSPSDRFERGCQGEAKAANLQRIGIANRQRGQKFELKLDYGDIRGVIKTDSICWQLATVGEGHNDFVRVVDDAAVLVKISPCLASINARTARLYLTLTRSVVGLGRRQRWRSFSEEFFSGPQWPLMPTVALLSRSNGGLDLPEKRSQRSHGAHLPGGHTDARISRTAGPPRPNAIAPSRTLHRFTSST
jgi:hypothetical protein